MKFELSTLTQYTEEAILAEIRRVAGLMKEGERLSRRRFDQLAKVHSSTLEARFGTWAAALDKAGVSEEIAPRPKFIKREVVITAIREYVQQHPREPVPQVAIATKLGFNKGTITRQLGSWQKLVAEVNGSKPLSRRYTEQECLENILTLWTHYGRQPYFGELKKPPSTVGPKPYIVKWGGWRAALAAFIENVNQRSEPVGAGTSNTEKTADAFQEQAAELSPRSLSLSLRYVILSRDKFRCVACGASPAKDGHVELHVDHIHPWSQGGKNTAENLRTLCSKCNLGKGARLDA